MRKLGWVGGASARWGVVLCAANWQGPVANEAESLGNVQNGANLDSEEPASWGKVFA